ncbi:MAG: Nramp family divalent metal transporter [Flavobacteriales bacterium]|nr:Nramp family divalent metal transporter [Flavobacteriales bacterium]
MSSETQRNLLKTLGPGILFASTAIGVSHLVQSTQAGANYGFSLLWAVIIANVLKYPFFEYGSRYANATGTSIIEGYKKLGKPFIWGYFIITIGSMFFVSAAVGKVTTGFMQNLFGISSTYTAMTIIFLICGAILISGRYKVLDGLIKIIGGVLLISTLFAFIMTLIHGRVGTKGLFEMNWFPEGDNVIFLIALMGWMPTAVDLSAWNSLWTVERIKQTGYRPKLKETLLDFRIGYWISAALSICFVTLGAFLMYGTDQKFSPSMAGFANEVINLYTTTIGEWSYLIIAAAAFSIMFGTCIAIFDGYGRSLAKVSSLIFNTKSVLEKEGRNYQIGVAITVVGSFLVIALFENNADGFKFLVNFAQTLSFVLAPFIAWANFKLVSKSQIGESSPGAIMRVISITGIIFLSGFSIYYLWFLISAS